MQALKVLFNKIFTWSFFFFVRNVADTGIKCYFEGAEFGPFNEDHIFQRRQINVKAMPAQFSKNEKYSQCIHVLPMGGT